MLNKENNMTIKKSTGTVQVVSPT